MGYGIFLPIGFIHLTKLGKAFPLPTVPSSRLLHPGTTDRRVGAPSCLLLCGYETAQRLAEGDVGVPPQTPQGPLALDPFPLRRGSNEWGRKRLLINLMKVAGQEARPPAEMWRCASNPWPKRFRASKRQPGVLEGVMKKGRHPSVPPLEILIKTRVALRPHRCAPLGFYRCCARFSCGRFVRRR